MMSEVPTKKIIIVHDTGEEDPVTVTYHEPTVKDLKELANRNQTVMEGLQKYCEVLLRVNGERQPTAWWDILPESKYTEFVSFMYECRPEAPKGDSAVALPLLYRP